MYRAVSARRLRSENRSRRGDPQERAILGTPTPKPAVAPRDEGQTLVVAGPCRVFRQLELFFCRIPAFAFLAELLHLGRRLLQLRQLVLSVLLCAESATRIRMAWNEAVPIHCEHFLDRFLGFQRMEVDHASTRHPADRKEIDDEDDLLPGQP